MTIAANFHSETISTPSSSSRILLVMYLEAEDHTITFTMWQYLGGWKGPPLHPFFFTKWFEIDMYCTIFSVQEICCDSNPWLGMPSLSYAQHPSPLIPCLIFFYSIPCNFILSFTLLTCSCCPNVSACLPYLISLSIHWSSLLEEQPPPTPADP